MKTNEMNTNSTNGDAMKEESTEDREIVIERTFDAPRALVFAAFTDPAHLPRWWGPRGFSCHTKEIDIRVGGAWRFDMHGPDGKVWVNRIIWQAIEPPARLVYTIDAEQDPDPARFTATVTFEERGARTHVTMRSLFQTAEWRANVVSFGAIELGRSTLDKLAELLAAQ